MTDKLALFASAFALASRFWWPVVRKAACFGQYVMFPFELGANHASCARLPSESGRLFGQFCSSGQRSMFGAQWEPVGRSAGGP